MNANQIAIEGYNRISSLLNGDPPWKPVAPSAPSQPEPAPRAVKSLAEILDEEAAVILPKKTVPLSATEQPGQPGPRRVESLAEILDREAGVIPLSAIVPSEEADEAGEIEAGERQVVSLAAILNAEDALQTFHINTSQIISLSNSPQ